MSRPARRSGRAGDADDPTPVADALADVRTELGLPDSGALEALQARWEEVVGTPVASHARLGAVRDGVLTVVVDASPWATRLRYLVPEVVDVANRLVGPGVVREVRIRVQGPR